MNFRLFTIMISAPAVFFNWIEHVIEPCTVLIMVGLIELDVLINEPVGKASSYSNLVDGEVFEV